MPVLRRCFALVAAVLLILGSARPCEAQSITDVPIREGQVYWVSRSDGSEIKGFITARSLSGLRVSGPRATLDLPIDDVVRIAKPDDLRNWALIGAGVGVVLFLPYALDDAAPVGVGRRVVGTLGVAALYAGFGALIDKAIERRSTVYERPGGLGLSLTPMASVHALGMRAALRW